MNRAVLGVFLLCCVACPSWAAPAASEVTVRLEWPGGLGVRCGIPIGPAELLLRAEAGSDGAIRFVAGLDSPLALIGPLQAAGLLRQAAAPLAFGPGTGVAEEATGLRLDGSLSGSDGFSAQVTVIPDVLAFFWLHPEGRHGTWGCTVGTGRGAVSLDAAASAAERSAASPSAEWIAGDAPTPAGWVLHGASRVGVRFRGLSAAVAGGMSAAERAPPGWFAVCTAAAGSGSSGIDLLAAGSSRSYLGFGAGDVRAGLRAGVRLRLGGPLGRVNARYVMTVDPPGFEPGPFLHSDEELAVELERRWPAGDGAWEAALDLANRIENGTDGVMADDPSGGLSLGWESTRFRAGGAFDVDRDKGAAAEIAVAATGAGARVMAGGELRCAWPGGEPASLSVSGRARFAGGRGEWLLRAGVRNVALVSGRIGSGEPWGSVEWSVSSRSR